MKVSSIKAQVFCLYGAPEKNLAEELLFWLDEDPEHFLLILEEEQKDSSLIHDRARQVIWENEEELKQVAWETVFLSFEYAPELGNLSKKGENQKKAYARMAYFQEGIHLVASDFKERGVNFLHHFFQNASLIQKAKRGRDLFGQFSGVPAIICGAGPSLEKEMAQLKSFRDSALIFAGGTALDILAKEGFIPHFGGILDPHPPQEKEKCTSPTFFQTRIHPDRLAQVKGPRLWIEGGGNDFFEEGQFDGGWNAATFLTALAYHLGCNPIILVGVDLAQPKNKKYAGTCSSPNEEELIPIEGGLFTRKDWLFAADWLSTFAKEHPAFQGYNGSDGIDINGFGKKDLSSFSFPSQENLKGRIEGALSEAGGEIPLPDPTMIRQSLERCGTFCMEIIQLLEKLYPKPPSEDEQYRSLLLKMEEEVAYKKCLAPIWEIWKYPLKRKIPSEIPQEYGLGLNKWLFLKGVCEDA